ncbi:MAG: hypothetical protein ACYC0X_34965 [Pirellulaceae bacterium]
MDEYLHTAAEGSWIVAVFLGLTLFVGFGTTRLLLPGEWQRYRLLLAPAIGWCLLVLGLTALNTSVPVKQAVYLVIAAAAVANVFALRGTSFAAVRPRPSPQVARAAGTEDADGIVVAGSGWTEAAVPFLLGLGLIALALAPHVVQRSLGLLSINTDEELYYPAANYVLHYSVLGGPHSISERFLEGIRMYGWAFQYAMAATGALSGSPTFHVYMPVSYSLLGLSVPAWYLLFRELYGMGRGAAGLSTFLYCIVGLPLWFGAYGYGPQMGSLVAIPLGTVAFLEALRRGGVQLTVLAGIAIAAGLTSYYRGIGLHYLLTLLPLVTLAAKRVRSVWPGTRRALAVAAIALLAGLPSHWYVGNWYFVGGAIQQVSAIGENWSEGWGVTSFQPISVALGTEAYTWVRDAEGSGPLAFARDALLPWAPLATWLVLALAALGLLHLGRKRPEVLAVLVGFAAYMALDRFMLDFKYGYFKLLAVAGPMIHGLAVQGMVDLRRRFGDPARIVVAVLLAGVVVQLSYNSYETFWFSAKGWGLSIPDWVAPSLRDMGRRVEPGARVFIAGRFQYPVPPDRVQVRKDHIFAMQSEKELRFEWARRVRAMAMTELLHADVYGWYDTEQVWRGYHRLLPDEEYDYYLLGPDNDPRVEGLGPEDQVWSDGSVSLYEGRGVVRESPWTLWKKRGSLAISLEKPLTVALSSNGLQFDEGLGQTAGPASEGRLRVGIMSSTRVGARVQVGGQSQWLTLEPGLTWYTTPTVPLPSSLRVQPTEDQCLGVVSLRLLGPGPEETDFVPESVIGDDIYASSSVLRLEHWLTDPFRGKDPGSL